MAQQQQQQAIHKFVLGSKEIEGKTAEFGYDRGWYSITNIVGEEREVIYKSRNAQEAYMKWNVYIGRKKVRSYAEERRRSETDGEQENSGERGYRPNRNNRSDWDSRPGRERGSAQGKDYRGENRNSRSRNRANQNGTRSDRNYRDREDQGSREARRDRRRGRSDRSRRDRDSAEQSSM